jgi:hypothetical protein
MKEQAAVEQAEKEKKKQQNKVVEEERQKKNIEDRRDDTHPMEVDIPGTSTAGIETNLIRQRFRTRALGAISAK